MKIYFATKLKDYVWLEINDNKLHDLAAGNHYAGCRCTLTHHPLEKCKEFNNCLKNCLKQMREEQFKSYIEVRQILGEQYKKLFDSLDKL